MLVRPGAGVPADGVVRDGSSDVNESMITGESRPVRKDVGTRVIAGTVNGSGSLRVEVTGTGDKTALAGIMRLVAQAQSSRSRAQALADRAAFLLTVVAIVAAVITFVGWSLAGKDASFVIERVVTVLVITYRYEDLAGGGAVRIETKDARALDAVHAFLRYQITEHGTGDPMK